MPSRATIPSDGEHRGDTRGKLCDVADGETPRREPAARQDLLNILRYLVQEAKSSQEAATLLERLETAAVSLREFPERGRVVPELGSPRRELLVEGYRLVYRVRSEVEILRRIHSRQHFPRAWKEGGGKT